MRGLPGYAAVVLAGGAGRRLGGAGKPVLPVGGRPMLHRVLDAVAGARIRVVVGPAELPLPDGVLRTQEQPTGAGPVAATAAGLLRLPDPDYSRIKPDPGTSRIELVALLAADLPLLTPAAVDTLRQRLSDEPAADGAAYLDGSGSRQWLCGVWRVAALRRRLAQLGDPRDRSLKSLVGGLAVAWIGDPRVTPWWDCDTEADLRRAEEWIHDEPE